MPTEYLGRYAVPPDILGGVSSRRRNVPGHHSHICSGVRHHHAVHERDLYKRRGERRCVIMFCQPPERNK